MHMSDIAGWCWQGTWLAGRSCCCWRWCNAWARSRPPGRCTRCSRSRQRARLQARTQKMLACRRCSYFLPGLTCNYACLHARLESIRLKCPAPGMVAVAGLHARRGEWHAPHTVNTARRARSPAPPPDGASPRAGARPGEATALLIPVMRRASSGSADSSEAELVRGAALPCVRGRVASPLASVPARARRPCMDLAQLYRTTPWACGIQLQNMLWLVHMTVGSGVAVTCEACLAVKRRIALQGTSAVLVVGGGLDALKMQLWLAFQACSSQVGPMPMPLGRRSARLFASDMHSLQAGKIRPACGARWRPPPAAWRSTWAPPSLCFPTSPTSRALVYLARCCRRRAPARSPATLLAVGATI